MRFVWGLFFLVVLGGCVGRSVGGWSNGALISSVGQRGLADSVRLSVIDEVLRRELDSDERGRLGEIFGEVVGSRLHSPVVRGRVLEAIGEDYKADGSVWLGGAVVDCVDEELRGRMIGSLVELGDKRAIGYLAETLGQGSDDSRELVDAIEAISGGPLAGALEDLLLDGEQRLGVRLAAMVCLVRGQGKAAVKEIIISAEVKDGFLENVSFWAEGYDYLPGNMMSFYMCVWQRGRLTDGDMEELRRRLIAVERQGEYEFDICDSHLLLAVGGEDLLSSRGELAADIGGRLGGLAHTKRGSSYSGAVDDYREDFVGRCKLFGYTDLLRIRLLLDWLGRAGNIELVRGFLRADANERLSEVGGLWFLDDAGEVEFKRYEPGQKAGDNQYIESDELLSDAALCLGRWHCHVDQWRGKELAGPGSDDMRYGRYVHTPVVVITLLGGNLDATYNVDYLSTGSVVVDLGNY